MNLFPGLFLDLIQKLKFNYIKIKYSILNKFRNVLAKLTIILKKYTFSILLIVLVFVFLYCEISIQSYDFVNILTALAGIIATILALVFTLSLIPIQNAATMWSFSILRIYKEDKVNYGVFLTLGSLVLVFVSLAIFEKSINDNFLFIFLILSIGAMLDILRFYYAHVVSLMDPQSILEKIKVQAFKTIDSIDDTAKMVAKNQYFLQEKEYKIDLQKLEAEAYKIIPSYPQAIKYWFNDLAEIYQKSVGRNDLIVAKATLSYIVDILDYSVKKRKNNISYHNIQAGVLFVKEADITQDIITPLCEILKDLFDISCKNSTENMALEVITTYKTMAINLSKKDINLIVSPIHYAKECIKNAQLQDSIEIPFQSAQIMYEAHRNIEDENAFLILDENLIELFEDTAKYLYSKNRSEAAEIILKYFMRLNKFDTNFKERFEKVLEVADRLVLYGIVIEIAKNKLFYNPLGEVYSLTCVSSIGNIYQYAAERNDTNLLVDILEVIYRHLRGISEKYDIQNSFMIHEINSTIEHISGINVDLLQDSQLDASKLNGKFKWLLSFYWIVYDKKETFNEQHLRRCMKTLKKIAISYMENGFDDVTSDALSHMKAILDSISKISKNEYLIQDIQQEYDEVKKIMEMQS